MTCKCDYSYICPECQRKIEVQNQLEYQRELSDWIVDSIEEIAKKLDVSLPDRPKERGRYDD